MTKEEMIIKYKSYRDQMKAINYALYLISWDAETEAPSNSVEERSKQIGILSEMSYKLERNEEYISIVKTLYEEKDCLDELLKIEIKKVYKQLMQSLKIPMNELVDYSILLSKSHPIWVEAKLNSDFNLFKDTLKEIIDFNKRMVKYLETDNLKGYDVLLDEYEEGMTKEKYDKFFSLLKEEIVPLVKEISSIKKEPNKLLQRTFSVEKQKKFADYLMDVMCYDKTRGLMKESEHPFTSGFGTTDVRVTNHYYEDLLLSSIFSAIHELGHATYEQQCDSSLNETLLTGGTSMAMHESQSRFYENIVGRSYPFWVKHYAKLQEIFKEELKDITLEEFYLYANEVECSLIRTEADELTYPLHVMVRYEIEKMIIEGDVNIDELPAIWNRMYKDYLGVDVPNDKLGILQDVHWAGGSFGYFPTYALGSAYGAQLLASMKKDLNFDEVVSMNNLKDVNEWLKEKIHKYGQTKTSDELLQSSTGESFDAKYFVEYLKTKFKTIYKI